MIYDKDGLTIIDNYLPEEVFKQIRYDVLDPNKPQHVHVNWNIAGILSNSTKPSNFQFTNTCYIDLKYPNKTPGIVDSRCFKYLLPLLKFINPYILLRVKTNVTTLQPAKDIKQRYFHLDVEDDVLHKGMTAIYYLNTTDGPTVFEDPDIADVRCVENRIMVFPNHWRHSIQKHTDKMYRSVVNINWIDKEKEQRYSHE